MSIWRGRLLVLTGILGLAACGPVIETHYDYLPPDNKAALSCVNTCQQSQNQCLRDDRSAQQECRSGEDYRVAQANQEARDDYNYALDVYYDEKRRRDRARQRYFRDHGTYDGGPGELEKPSEPYDDSPSYYRCEQINSSCVPNFNMCYRSCGGQVGERQVCVANCDQ